MAGKREQRRRTFTDREVQGALMRRWLVHWCAFLVTTLFLAIICQVLTGGLWMPLSEHLAQLWYRYSPAIIVFACLVPAFMWDTLRLSHRFAGPITRLRAALHRLGAGEPVQPLRFRKGDFWHELAKDFNSARDRLEDAKQALRTQVSTAAEGAADEESAVC